MPLTEYLEREHPELGPVATWEDDAIVLILADDEPDPATAARESHTSCERGAARDRTRRPLPDGLRSSR